MSLDYVIFIYNIVFMTKLQKDEVISEDYKNLISIDKIKKKYNTSYERVKRVCLERGIWNPEGRTFYMKKHCKDNLRSVQHNPFQNLDDEEVQYWLGMLATDGCVFKNTIALSLSYEDLKHLEKYKLFLNSNLKISTSKDKRFKNSSISCFTFSNYDVVLFLNSIGITEKKTFSLKLNIPITWNILRGIIDGDGCYYKGFSKKTKINHCRVSISTASENFANQISDFYTLNNIKHQIYFVKKRNFYSINVNNFINCKKLIYNLYNNANIYLNRKYFKAQLISNYQLKKDLKFREPALGILSETNTP